MSLPRVHINQHPVHLAESIMLVFSSDISWIFTLQSLQSAADKNLYNPAHDTYVYNPIEPQAYYSSNYLLLKLLTSARRNNNCFSYSNLKQMCE